MATEPADLPFRLEAQDPEFRDVLEDEFPHPLQAVVLPVIVMKNDGLAYLQGTAFSVGSDLAMTAHHVLTQDDTAAISGFNEGGFVPGDVPGSVHATLIEVEEVTAHPGSTDISVLRLKTPPDGEHNPLPVQPMRLGMAPPPAPPRRNERHARLYPRRPDGYTR